ncbi:NAD(P)/FAD-dependent oxidoreductase [Pseudoruegeria sp. HB172150]|uniref:NAD(P)/FAD-dependent oxidoreductase n=1 Tax=Pseudoruegeria sp. HB172150 TaxID=2721164 RepID=UPI001553B151|nr:NAD(P)/FAD-dependent oxidoreductase [Pseudoruegeria sp. HB172150]
MTHDVIVIGGSYAGMAAALQIARARRNVLVIDAGQRRNRFAAHSHGFLGQDGADPAQIAETAKAQLLAYPTLAWADGSATNARATGDGYAVRLPDGSEATARRLVLATGVTDTLPDIPGLAERWGRHIFHCPYCHGYEQGGGAIGIIATGPMAVHQAELLTDWGTVTLLTNDVFTPDADQRRTFEARGITVEPTPIAALEGSADVRLADGRTLSFAGLFTATRTQPSSGIAETLGCAMDEAPMGTQVRVDEMKQTSLPGVFACGDLSSGMHSVSLAIGAGALAGVMAHRSLVF